MITCDLMPMDSLDNLIKNKKKFGRYHGSNFWDVKKFGSKKWVIGAYIGVEDEDIFNEENLDCDYIALKCLEFLNQVPPRKKYAKKIPKPKYGKLEYYDGSAKLVTRSGKRCLSVLLVVDSRKNKLFWGKGQNV